jgi:tRNA splicing ligase
MIEGSLTKDSLEFLQDNDVSLLFEVVDPVFDPHIEPYDRKVLYLLDAVKNKMEFEKHPRVNTMEFLDTIRGSHVPIEMVEEIDTVNSFNELKKYLDPKQELLSPLGIEGFVFSFGDEWKPYMIKTKTEWYKFWKWARTLKEKMYRIIKKKGGLSKGDIAELSLKLHSYEQHEVFKFFLENQEMLQQDIISLRNKMLHNKITQ